MRCSFCGSMQKSTLRWYTWTQLHCGHTTEMGHLGFQEEPLFLAASSLPCSSTRSEQRPPASPFCLRFSAASHSSWGPSSPSLAPGPCPRRPHSNMPPLTATGCGPPGAYVPEGGSYRLLKSTILETVTVLWKKSERSSARTGQQTLGLG